MGRIFPSQEELFEEFDAWGEDAVRLWLNNSHGGWPSFIESYRRRVGVLWLAAYERAARLRNEASNDESLEIAKSAKDAAWDAAKAARNAAREAKNANTIAALALIAAVIAMAIAIVGLFLRR